MCLQNCNSHTAGTHGFGSAEESLLLYCKPVELYNILRRRASANPCFLRRCLQYETGVNRKRRRWDGVVIFNYRDHNNIIRKTEVTEDFSCPFCLMQCISYKGLRIHLNLSHDLFNFEFWVTEDYRAVNVSLKFDNLKPEILAGLKYHQQSFFFCSKLWRQRKQKTSNQVQIQFLELESFTLESESAINGPRAMENDAENVLKSSSSEVDAQDLAITLENHVLENVGAVELMECAVSSSAETGIPTAAQVSSDPDCSKLLLGNDPGISLMGHTSKLRKLTVERRGLIQKRQFYHSHRVQPMVLEQVLSDQDSEDEVDDEIADLEDRRMLDDFVDVSKDEKQLMHLWNSFVRKQKVIADGHVSWACEAFSKLHGPQLISTPPLFWCWRFFLIKLWNHGLLDANAMNNCNMILETQRHEMPDQFKIEHEDDK